MRNRSVIDLSFHAILLYYKRDDRSEKILWIIRKVEGGKNRWREWPLESTSRSCERGKRYSRSNFLFCLIYALIHGMIGSFEADFPESTYNAIGSRTPLSAASLVRPNLNYTINLLSEN